MKERSEPPLRYVTRSPVDQAFVRLPSYLAAVIFNGVQPRLERLVAEPIAQEGCGLVVRQFLGRESDGEVGAL